MSDLISIDYEQMQNIGSQFDREADVVNKVLNDLKNQIQVLRSGGLISDAANAWYQEMDSDVLPAVQRFIEALMEAQQVTNQIISTMQTADDEASRYLPKN